MNSRIKYLFTQYYKNQCTKLELEEFLNVLHSSNDDEEIAMLIKKTYEDIVNKHPSLSYINEEGQLIVDEGIAIKKEKTQSESRTRKKFGFAKLAFAALLILLPFALWIYYPSSTLNEMEISVPMIKQFTNRGEHKYIVLEDGTQVWLNANSTLSYPEKFDSKKREVYLSGEAFFDVKHAEKIPFHIHSAGIVTKVLGTSFNIKAYPNQQNVSVAVQRGKVEVLKTNKKIATLTKGEKIKINEKATVRKSEIIKEEKTEALEVGAWQRGYLIYRDEVFEDIISDMEQIYNTRIDIEKDSLKSISVTTSFTQDIGAEKALSILCKLVDAELEIKDHEFKIKDK